MELHCQLSSKGQAMSDWISIKDRLPELGTPIWMLFCKKNGKPRKVKPVQEGDYGKFRHDWKKIGFILGEHRTILFTADYCPRAGLTHWQPRVDNTPPSPELAVIEAKGQQAEEASGVHGRSLC